MPARINAPFSDDLVAFLNARQDAGRPRPYVCPDHPVSGVLVAGAYGLWCPRPGCGYSQDWVWASGEIPGYLGGGS